MSETEELESMIASLKARLNKVSDLAVKWAGSGVGDELTDALNGYTRAEPKCEGRTPFDCGNPTCPAHPTPTTRVAPVRAELAARRDEEQP